MVFVNSVFNGLFQWPPRNAAFFTAGICEKITEFYVISHRFFMTANSIKMI